MRDQKNEIMNVHNGLLVVKSLFISVEAVWLESVLIADPHPALEVPITVRSGHPA